VKAFDYKYNFEPISNRLTDFEKTLLNLEQVRYIENPNRFHKESAYLKSVDGKLSYYYLFSKIKSNDFNEGSGYLSHGFDFYRGSFHGQMVRGLINYCNLIQGDLILDPFCGSGTTLIESKLLGFDSIGIDINPIACLNSIIKTQTLTIPLSYLLRDNKTYLELSFFHEVLESECDFNRILNYNIKELLYLFLHNRAISMENRLNISRIKSLKINLQRIIGTLKKFEILKKQIEINWGSSQVVFNNNLNYLKKMKSQSVDAIITSPPYLDLIDYIEEDLIQIKNYFTKEQISTLKRYSIGNEFLSRERTENKYWSDNLLLFRELYRVLRKNRNFIFVIGNYRDMKEKFLTLAKKTGFYLERVLKREIVNIKKKDNCEYVLFLIKN